MNSNKHARRIKVRLHANSSENGSDGGGKSYKVAIQWCKLFFICR